MNWRRCHKNIKYESETIGSWDSIVCVHKFVVMNWLCGRLIFFYEYQYYVCYVSAYANMITQIFYAKNYIMQALSDYPTQQINILLCNALLDILMSVACSQLFNSFGIYCCGYWEGLSAAISSKYYDCVGSQR